MKKVLSIQDIINGSVIEDSVDVKLLSKTLGIAQETGLKPILGNDLYTGLIDAFYDYSVSGTSLSTAYTNLIEAAKPYLIAKTVADFILISNYKVSNKGLLKLNDDSATSLSNTDLENVKNYYDNQVSTYKADLVKYLKDTNLLDYNNDVQVSSESTGWFFGNTFNINNQVKQEVKTIAEYVAPAEGSYSYQQLDTLRNVLLINASEIISSSVINDNVDVWLLSITIQTVQETYLKPILTENIYADTLNAVYQHLASGSTIGSFYQDLLTLIKPYMVNKVVAEFIIPNNYKFTAKGLMKLNDNSATALSDSDLENVKNYYDNLSTTYKIDIVNFLQKYILVENPTDNNITSDATGWFLSDIKPSSNTANSNVHPTIFTDNDRYVTGATFGNNILSLTNNSGDTVSVTISGLTFADNDTYVTGGTYSNGTAVFKTNSGTTFSVSGFYTGATDLYTTGATLSTNILTFTKNNGTTYAVSLSAFSSTDTYVTGGTYANGSIAFRNNTGGTFNVVGLYTGNTEVFVTGGTYSNGITTFTNNTGGTFSVTGYNTGNTEVFVTGGTYTAGTTTFRNNTGGTFSIAGYYTGFTVTTSGSSGSSTYISNNLNIPSYSLSGLGGISGSGTANYVPKWSGTTGLTLSSIYVDGSGNVGLGTTTPFFTGLLGGKCFEVSGSPYAGLVASSNNVRAWLVANDANSIVNFGSTTNHPIVFYTNNTENARLATSGNLLIGTATDAGYKLDVNGGTRLNNDTINTGRLVVGTTGFINFDPLQVQGNTTILGNLSGLNKIANNNYSSLTYINTPEFGAHGWDFYTPDTGHTTAIKRFSVGSDEASNSVVKSGFYNSHLVIPDGFVGIGTGTPANALHINSTNPLRLVGVQSASDANVLTIDANGVVHTILASALSSGSGVTSTDTYVTGGTYSAGVATFRNNTGGTFTVTGFSTSGGTGSDTYVTGGTYSNGTTTFRNNTGGTFNVTGYYTGATDVFVTGGTYANGAIALKNNTGGTFNITGLYTGTTDIDITGGTYANGVTTLTNNTGGTINITGYYTGNTEVYVTGGTYSAGVATLKNNTGGTFTVTGFTTSPSFIGIPTAPTALLNTSTTQLATTEFVMNQFSSTTVYFSSQFGGLGTSGSPITFTAATSGSSSDTYVTGGTYSSGTLTFKNNTGGTFTVTGLSTGGSTGSTLSTKSGLVASGSFTGSPRKATVTFSSSFASTNYSIVVTGEDARIWTTESKSTGGFVINSNSDTALAGTTSWIAVLNGEA